MQKPDLSEIDTEMLVAELSRRRLRDKRTLDEVERSLEDESQADKRRAFEQWLRGLESVETNHPKPCPRCGDLVAVNAKKRPHIVMTLQGRFEYRRNHHYCEQCKHGFHPMDAQVEAPERGQATEQLQRRMMDFAVNDSYGEAVERFAIHYPFSVSTCLMRSVVERLPMPVYEAHERVAADSRLTVQADGSMLPTRQGWKEAKLATVLSEAHHTPGAQDQRGCVTQASYVATMGDVKAFEAHLKQVLPPRIPLQERGKTTHAEVVWLGDGASWIWKMQQRICPTAISILDWYHAVEHASACGKVVLEGDEVGQQNWVECVSQHLWEGRVQRVITELKECLLITRTRAKREALNALVTYYTANQKRMNYPEHRAAGRMIGSGQVESAHRHVLQTRMKKAGQHWSQQGAEKMVRLRATYRTKGPSHFFDYLVKSAA